MSEHSTQREQRRGTSRAFMWWSIGGSLVLCAIVAAWAFLYVPKGGPAGTAQRSGSTGVLANQGAGESMAAKHDAITPGTSAVTGAGQNSPGAAAQIEHSAGPLKLTDRQRQEIRSYFAGRSAGRVDNADFALSIGAAVPANVQLQKLPAEVSDAMGGFQGDQYVLVRNQLVIVDPSARRVVALVPDAG